MSLSKIPAPISIELPPALTNRRSMLGLLGMAGLACATGAGPAHAAASTNRIDLTGLSPEWVRLHGQTLIEYTRYIHSLKLRFITTEQVISAHAKSKGSTWNTLPPKAWWNRMGYTLRVVDRLALHLRVPVKELVSAYRNPAYNRGCSGARSGSWHQANMAVDVVFPTRPSTVTAVARDLRDRGLFKGGIGGYGSFTHVDTRGENINW
jgi:hypothetical protein